MLKLLTVNCIGVTKIADQNFFTNQDLQNILKVTHSTIPLSTAGCYICAKFWLHKSMLQSEWTPREEFQIRLELIGTLVCLHCKITFSCCTFKEKNFNLSLSWREKLVQVGFE